MGRYVAWKVVWSTALPVGFCIQCPGLGIQSSGSLWDSRPTVKYKPQRHSVLSLPWVPLCLCAGLRPHSSSAALGWVHADTDSCGTIALRAQLMLLYLLIYVFLLILWHFGWFLGFYGSALLPLPKVRYDRGTCFRQRNMSNSDIVTSEWRLEPFIVSFAILSSKARSAIQVPYEI